MPFNIVDAVFTRSFFTTVSWTGMKRTNCKAKGSFSQFVCIRKLFYNLCHSVDKNYTMSESDEWLKSVAIGTSGSRLAAKGVRASRVKHRKTTGTKPKVVSTENELLLDGSNSLSQSIVSTPSSATENIENSFYTDFEDIDSPLPTSPLGKFNDVASNSEESNNVGKNSSSCDFKKDEMFTVRENYWCQSNMYIHL